MTAKGIIVMLHIISLATLLYYFEGSIMIGISVVNKGVEAEGVETEGVEVEAEGVETEGVEVGAGQSLEKSILGGTMTSGIACMTPLLAAMSTSSRGILLLVINMVPFSTRT